MLKDLAKKMDEIHEQRVVSAKMETRDRQI